MEENNWYNTGEPFNLEVEITDDSMRKTVEDMILRSVTRGTELLPGLKINKAYKQTLDKQDVLSSEMEKDFKFLMESFQEAFNEFFKKWDKDANPELRYTTKIETNYSSDGSFNGWSPATNCIHNCKKCFAKCMYRKKENPDQLPKQLSTSKNNSGWNDYMDVSKFPKF